MNEEKSIYPSVGRQHEIDQRAVKVFQSWIPDNWLVRPQAPDFFVDFLVETVEQGEPTGRQFAAQIKGFDEASEGQTLTSFSFKTKHLRYYLEKSQHPVFLFRINTTSREGVWVFAQKHLKEKASPAVLNNQKFFTVHFLPEDNLLNETKFRCLLPNAESFVRDLHPGSILAAIKKRTAELEAKDPRCLVSVAVQDGKERITISPREPFTFTTKIRSSNPQGWRDFFERGAAVRLEPGEMEIVGAPLLAEIHKGLEGHSTLQFGNKHPAHLQYAFDSGTNISVVQLDGEVRAGTKFANFRGSLPDSPLETFIEIPFDARHQSEATESQILLSLDKWVGHPVLLLPYFDQIESLVSTLAKGICPKTSLFVRGNVLWSGVLGNIEVKPMQDFLPLISWLRKCRWLAQKFNVNPPLTSLKSLTDEQWDAVVEMHDLFQSKNIVVPAPGIKLSCSTSAEPNQAVTSGGGDGILRIEKEEVVFDIFGQTVRIGPIRYEFTEMRHVTFVRSPNGGTKYTFNGTGESKRIVTLLD